MSNISDIHTLLKSEIETILPNHAELSNPYQTDQNSEQQLRVAYGIRVSSGTNTNRAVGCLMSIARTIEIVLTRKYIASERNIDAKQTAEKNLLEDQYLLLKRFENYPYLGDNTKVSKFVFDSDGGIEFVFGEDKPFYQIISTFTLEYFEDLT